MCISLYIEVLVIQNNFQSAGNFRSLKLTHNPPAFICDLAFTLYKRLLDNSRLEMGMFGYLYGYTQGHYPTLAPAGGLHLVYQIG